MILLSAFLSLFSFCAGAAPLDEGMKLMKAERYTQAVQLLEKAARNDPGSPDLLRNLGWAYLRLRRLDDAWRCWDLLVKLDPSNATYHRLLADVELERGNYNAALESVGRALRLAPNDVDASLTQAKALLKLKRFQQAKEQLERLMRAHPNHLGVQFAMADTLDQMGRQSEALVYFDKIVKAEPQNADYRRNRARVLFDVGQTEAAISEWKYLAARKPDEETLLGLGWAYWKLQRTEDAFRVASTLVKTSDSNPVFLRLMASVELDRQNYEEALKWAQRAYRIQPSDRNIALVYSKVLFRMGRDKEAMRVVERLENDFPDSLTVEYHMAEFLAQLDRPEKALSRYDKLIKLDPKNPVYRRGRGRALYQLGRFDKALEEWQALAGQKPPDEIATQLLLNDAINRKAWDEAMLRQDKLGAIRGRDEKYWERKASIFRESKRYEEALAAYDRSISIDAPNIDNYYSKGDILEQLGDTMGARLMYEQALSLNPNSYRAMLALARVEEEKENFIGALRWHEEIDKISTRFKRYSPYYSIEEARLLAETGRIEDSLEILRYKTRVRAPAIAVLLYHGVSRFDRSPSIPQSRLKSHLFALKKAGYQAITADDLERFIRKGAKLPKKPILITFDDSRQDSFRLGDPVLEAAGMKATMFVLSPGDKPHYYAGREELEKWRQTGRWELQSHGIDAHDPIEIDGQGHTGHFFSNLMWLEEKNRLETTEEFKTRLETEYRDCVEFLREFNPKGRIAAFAYPFGDYGQSDYTNYPQAADINKELIEKYYDIAFVQEENGFNTGSSSPYELTRFEVPKDMTADKLLEHLAMREPWVKAKMLEASLWSRTGQPGLALGIYDELNKDGIDAPEVWVQRGVAMRETGNVYEEGRLYRSAVSADPENLHYQSLLEQNGSFFTPRVGPEVETYSDNYANGYAKGLMRLTGAVKAAKLQAWAGQDRYRATADPLTGKHPSWQAREAGAGASVFVLPRAEIGGAVFRRQFDFAPKTPSNNYNMAGSWLVSPQLRFNLLHNVDDVETATAVRNGRRLRSYGGGLSWDLAMNWNALADYQYIAFNDKNLERDMRFELTRRIGVFSLGYSFRDGDSPRLQPDYWTPRNLRQHMALVGIIQPFGERSEATGLPWGEFRLQGGAGYGFQQGYSSNVASLDSMLIVRLANYVSLNLEGFYGKKPNYMSRRLSAGISLSY